MPVENPLDFSDIGTLAKENKGSGLDFSDIATPSKTEQSSGDTVPEFESRPGGGLFSNNELARAVARGTASAAGSALDFVRTFADSDTLKKTSDSLAELARNIPSKAGSLDDVIKDPTLIPAYVARVVGELAPQAVLAYLSGGTGAALGRAAGLSQAGVRAATGAGAAATSIPQEVGQIARETEELTGKIDSGAALTYGIPSGMLDALSAERIIGKVFNQGTEEAKKRAWRQIVRDTLKEIPKSAAVEGATESAQEGLHILADHAADQTFDLLTEKNGMRILESAVAGAIGGGLLGGGMQTIQLPIQKQARNQAAQDVRLTRTLERTLRELRQEEKPVREPDETELDYGNGGEMPSGPAIWKQVATPSSQTVSAKGTGGGELPSVKGPSLEGQPYEATNVPVPERVVVQAPQQYNGETVPGYVTIQSKDNKESGPMDYWRKLGHDIPDYSQLPTGSYSVDEANKLAQFMAAMTPAERERFINERTPQTPTVPKQTPAPVVEKEQTKSLPPNPEGVRNAEASAVALPPGIVEVTDLSQIQSAADNTKYKTKVEVQYDPGKRVSGKKSGPVQVLIAVNPDSGRNAGKLLIQTKGSSKTRTIWSADLKELRQSGVLEGNRLNLEQLWRSPFLIKNPSRDFAAYKLPGEKLERNADFEADAVVDEINKTSPFLGAVLSNLRDSGVLTLSKVKSLAGARTGGAEYAGKTATKLAQQLRDFVSRVLEERMAEGRRTLDTLSPQQKRELLGLAQAKEKIESGEPFTPEDVQALANYLANVSEVESVDKPANEVSIEDVRGSRFGGDEGGESSGENPIGATWDPARTDSIIGTIEDKNPKLYQSFEADPEDDAAWEKIEQELVKFLNGDKLSAEVLAEAIRQKRMEGWVAKPAAIQEEFEDHTWLVGIGAKGKDGIMALLNNRNIEMDPEMRRIGLALLSKIPSKYLEDLTFSVGLDGRQDGEFIPWLKLAKISLNSKDPTTAAHELSHYLAGFLTEKERSAISNIRKRELDLARQDPEYKEFFEWLDSKGGNATSRQYHDEWNRPNSPYAYINDDEYFAHYMSLEGAKPEPELKTLMSKVKDVLRQILTAIKAWAGDRDAYFEKLLKKLERGDFVVDSSGGMLWEANNSNGVKSLPPISSLPALRRFDKVDQGQEEKDLVNTLTVEQNQPLLGHAIPALQQLDRRVRAELPGLVSRAAALVEAGRRGGAKGETPLKHYAVLVNGIGLQEEGNRLRDEIEQLLRAVQEQNLRGSKASDAEARASFLEDTAQQLISDYKNYLLSEQRSNKNAGVAEGLVEAIKSIDSLRGSTESLKRGLEFLAQTMSLEELMDPKANTQQIVNDFKKKIMDLTGAPTWQQAIIPAGGEKPGISNEQLRIAVRIMQERQNLVQDIISYKELSDPELAKLIATGEGDFNEEIASLNHKKLRQFLASYYSVRSKKDQARRVYLKHRAKLKDLIEKIDTKAQAEEFLYGNVIGSEQFQKAMSDASMRGFMAADLIRDNNGSDVLKRTYINPLNKAEKVEIIDGTTKEDYERNLSNYEKVATWYENALEQPNLDPLDRERINFELSRIYNMEMNDEGIGNQAYNPQTGKRSPGALNLPNILSNLTGSSLQFAMGKIGGRAAVQASAVFQARSEARRRVAEVRHDLQPRLQMSVVKASRSHGITPARWLKEVAEPVLASFNSVGSKQIKVGETTRYGAKVTPADMEAIREMKRFSDAMARASGQMDLHTAKLHPVKVKEIVAGREILRDQQGGTELIMPRRFNDTFTSLLNIWSRTKNNRNLKDSNQDLANLIQSGQMFEELLLAHIYSTQRYPDYAYKTRFVNGYREIYKRILDGNPPSNLEQVVDTIFEHQTGLDVSRQLSKEDIVKTLVSEVDAMASKVLDQQAKDRAADTPGQSISIQSADNFMTRPRGEMIAPDSGYQYSIASLKDIRWMTQSVLEVHEQMARDGLDKIRKMLQEYIKEWSDRVKHPEPQKESREKQISGEDWLNYREAKQMLNQINRHLDNTSPDAFKSFLDEQFGSAGRKIWSIIVQALLQSATVLKNNLLGMNLRQIQFDQQWRGDGLWIGMPKWLLKLPTIAKNGIAWPMRDAPAYVVSSYAYRKALKNLKVNGLIGEDALHAIMHSPELFKEATAQINGYLLKRAVNVQRAKELGAAGKYGFKDQAGRYIKMFTYGGELIETDPNTMDKAKGVINSMLGLFQETGGGMMLPRSFAPRKLEQFLNFQAIRHADRLIDELTLNLKEAIQNREELGIKDQPVTDAELLGDSSAKSGEAAYMRSIFNRAGLNLDAMIERLKNNPGRDLLEPSEWNSFVLEVAKEMNMPASDNRVTYKSAFARLMSSLMGYGMWYNERMAEALAGHSRKKFDPAAIYRAMFFIGTIAAMGVMVGTPIQRLIKRLLFNEEDQTGKFSSDNTAWRNAAVLWEQTAPFWPIIGSVFSQLYDARAGGGKIFNFLPVTIASQALQFGNEVGQTGSVFYPAVKMVKTLDPNLKMILNRMPETAGLVDVNNVARSFRSVADGEIEIRSAKGGTAIKYSPASTQIQMAVNELVKENPDYEAINHYRADAVKEFMSRGANKQDAERRFDLSVLARFPQNTVYGRTLSAQEKLKQIGRMNQDQIARLNRVENAFDQYATTFGLRKPSEPPRLARSSGSSGGSVRSGRLTRVGNRVRRRSSRLVRNRSLRRRTRRLTRY